MDTPNRNDGKRARVAGKAKLSFAERAISDALVRLLERSPLDELTVKAVCDEAGVSRTSFYRHYETLLDVLERYQEYLAGEVSARCGEPGLDTVDYVGAILEVARENRTHLLVLHKRNLSYIVGIRLLAFMKSVLPTSAANDPFLLKMSGYGLYGLFLADLETGCNADPEDLISIATEHGLMETKRAD